MNWLFSSLFQVLRRDVRVARELRDCILLILVIVPYEIALDSPVHCRVDRLFLVPGVNIAHSLLANLPGTSKSLRLWREQCDDRFSSARY